MDYFVQPLRGKRRIAFKALEIKPCSPKELEDVVRGYPYGFLTDLRRDGLIVERADGTYELSPNGRDLLKVDEEIRRFRREGAKGTHG